MDMLIERNATRENYTPTRKTGSGPEHACDGFITTCGASLDRRTILRADNSKYCRDSDVEYQRCQIAVDTELPKRVDI